ncbi:hypothetical protein GBA52_027030 [Prunus armeniaca]|nr:hypothetical protein GBA52_027030 [Prunus armeniaca]
MEALFTPLEWRNKGHHLPAPAISSNAYVTMMKRMSELEEKVNVLSTKPALMPPEKEEMLYTTLNRINVLEQDLPATKKALKDALLRQEELVAYLDKDKKKRKFAICNDMNSTLHWKASSSGPENWKPHRLGKVAPRGWSNVVSHSKTRAGYFSHQTPWNRITYLKPIQFAKDAGFCDPHAECRRGLWLQRSLDKNAN